MRHYSRLPNTALVGIQLLTLFDTVMISTTKLGLSVQGENTMDTKLLCISWQVVLRFENQVVMICIVFSATDVWKGYQSHYMLHTG